MDAVTKAIQNGMNGLWQHSPTQRGYSRMNKNQQEEIQEALKALDAAIAMFKSHCAKPPLTAKDAKVHNITRKMIALRERLEDALIEKESEEIETLINLSIAERELIEWWNKEPMEVIDMKKNSILEVEELRTRIHKEEAMIGYLSL